MSERQREPQTRQFNRIISFEAYQCLKYSGEIVIWVVVDFPVRLIAAGLSEIFVSIDGR